MKTKRVFSVPAPRAKAAAALRPRIAETAGRLFLARGFVGVTSDEIAAALGISKATLYKAFPGKEAILREVVRGLMREIQTGVERLVDDRTLGFVEKMASLLAYLGAKLASFGPPLVRDLPRSAPGIWKEIEEFRREKVLRNFRIILEDGRREGCFRSDVDPDLLLAMFLDLIQEFVNPAAVLRSGRSPSETFGSIVKVFFQGILTDRGRRDFASRTPVLAAPGKEGVI